MTSLQKKIKFLGYYQVLGGLFGLAMTGMLAFTIYVFFPFTQLLLILIPPFALSALSVWAGMACIRRDDNAFNLSVISQITQLFSLILVGFKYKFFAGVYFGLGFNSDFDILFHAGLPSFEIGGASSIETEFVLFNLVAVYLIYWIYRLKDQQEVQKQIEQVQYSQSEILDEVF